MKILKMEIPCPFKQPCTFFRKPNEGKRQDIQGVRAIAILSVLLYHHFPFWFPNGLFGVDMFFALSGYIMSLVLARESEVTIESTFTFYKRRVKRIAPLYYLVVFVTAFVSIFTFSISWLQDSMSRLLPVISLYSNLNEIHMNRQYAVVVSADTHALFVHTWSLSVEMQFYLVVPLIFFLFKNIFKNNKYLCGGFSVFVIAISMYFSFFVLIRHNAQKYFYHTICRVWQFFVGILAFQMGSEYEVKEVSFSRSSIGGLIIIPIIVCNFLPVAIVPYVYRVVVTMCTGFLLLCGRFSNNRILTNSPMKYIGDLSYALYLIHWPTFTIFKYYSYWHNIPLIYATFAALPVTVVITIVVHHFYEKVLLKTHMLYSIVVSLVFALGCCALLFLWRPLHQYQMGLGANDEALNTNLGMLTGEFSYADGNYTSLKGYNMEYPWQFVTFPKGNGGARILVLGNSYARQQVQVIRRVIGLDYSDLYMYAGLGNNILYSYFKEITDASRELAFTLKPNILIISVRYFDKEKAPYDHSGNDTALIQFLEEAAYYERYVDHILIESPHPCYDMDFINNFIDRMERGLDMEGANMKLTEAQEDLKHVWFRIKALLTVCKKCRILHSDTPFIDEKRGIVRTYDVKTNLSYVDNTIHLTKIGLGMLDDSYASAIRPILETYRDERKER